MLLIHPFIFSNTGNILYTRAVIGGLQSHWRCHRASSSYKRLQKAAIVSQCGWRCRVARRELRKLKMACSLNIYIYIFCLNIIQCEVV